MNKESNENKQSVQLDSEKQKALSHDGNVLVTANPGTGKTFLLAEKYAKLLKEGFTEEDILCLTFTNKAKREMEKRILESIAEKGLEVDYSKLNVYTFHSYALERLDEGTIISTNLLRYVIYDYLKKNEVLNYDDSRLVEEIVPKLENLMRYLKSYGIMPENINVKETKKLLEDFQRSKDTIEKHEL